MSHPTHPVTDRLPGIESVLVALLAGVAGVAGSFAVAAFTPAFIAGPIAGFMARTLPGALITFSIVVLGDVGSQLNVLLAVGLSTTVFAVAALLGQAVGQRTAYPIAGVVAAATAALISVGITAAPTASVVAGVATGTVVLLSDLGRSQPVSSLTSRASDLSAGRRRLLAAVASAASLGIGGYVLGSQQSTQVSPPTFEGIQPWAAPEVEPLLAEAAEKSLDVSGLEPLVSDRFYEVDINSTDPTLDAASWSLTVTGTVDRELSYSYEDILAMEVDHQFVSLRCVGEALNGKKMDNALWTGVSIMDLVEPAGLPEGCCVMLRAADGFYEEFPLSALQDGFLAIGMNGGPLPRGHGYPARALIPGHWGEINVKWLTEIEILEAEQDGYWEERGWHGTGPVNTVAKLHVINTLDDGRKQVGGHAYAGVRGIDRVEVSTDGGDTWVDATLSDPLPGADVWRQWTHTYDPPEGEHEVVVRATDGTGALQPEAKSSPFPSGPSGWVTKTVR
ncbi:molybdopterin-dependent oxidoreductase [Haloferax larsenii]|uniref:Molybdopterin-dependent oxidoreductase n=1 Tax=Haloferax larsenii TaxID=302484 RepID=A0ABY5RBR3_HALLR|nr:molybdopterin-dependent oxidoreductase [Haloferax larsenii]ELZ82256.1 sulfite oxidase-like oxidoreductase [Haloferax larsenii JCM 13917]UVE49624.1 molybdopterin-dependent oxidoreductase [Haloferax larsenii]